MAEIVQTFYIAMARYPLRRVRVVQATVHVGKKMTWARPVDRPWRRYLIGATAFMTMASAERNKLGALTKMVNDKNNKRFRFERWADAENQLKKYHATGKFH